MNTDRRMMALDVDEMLVRTRSFTTEEVGFGFRLMNYVWYAGGRLPFDEQMLARMLGVQRPRFRKLWATIAPLFLVDAGALSVDPDVARPGRLESPEARPAIPSAMREEVWQRDGETCRYCGATD
ncbi:hypothetical protein, partial [Listeria welshimeri]|uniref:HNH endonuclease n=1 Tax=Listeria welshimeri TaxID=1643 RepID=UPI00320466EA